MTHNSDSDDADFKLHFDEDDAEKANSESTSLDKVTAYDIRTNLTRIIFYIGS